LFAFSEPTAILPPPQEVMNKEMNNMILSLIFTLQILIIHRLIGNR